MFTVFNRAIADAEPFEHLTGAEGLALGSAARYTGGSLEKCAATERPTHIVMGPASAAGKYPAIRVLPTTVFETHTSEAVADSVIGSAVTLNAEADGVTATTASGVFTVTWTDGAADGGVVQGYFA